MSADEVRKYLASIGAKGGAKSKRKLTKAQAKQMAAARWAKAKKRKSTAV
jgi:ribose 5-phosphate isomerase